MSKTEETTNIGLPVVNNLFNKEAETQSNKGESYSISEFDFDDQTYTLEIRLPGAIESRYVMMQVLQKMLDNPEQQEAGMKFIGRCITVTDEAGLMIVGMNKDGFFVYDNQRLNMGLLSTVISMTLLKLSR